MTKRLLALILAVAPLGASHAVLIDRGGGLIYDDVLNVTWLQDAYYAGTSGYADGAQMTWQEAVDWAENLVYFDSERGVTYSDWRLPTTPSFDAGCTDQVGLSYGYNCRASEMGHLFYDELGGLGGYSLTVISNANYSLFKGIQEYGYWSGSEDAPNSRTAWVFNMSAGYQRLDDKDDWVFNVWAVRDGDVAAVAVPEPGGLPLMLAGLSALYLLIGRRRVS